MLFRWYDPRVLAEPSPPSDDGQRRRLFGPITILSYRSPHAAVLETAAPPDDPGPPPDGPLTITASQVTALNQSAEGRFHVWLAGWLRAMVPEATTTLDPAGLAKRILDGLALARSYGIAGRRALAQFMAVDVVLGPGFFDEPAEILSILRDRVEARRDQKGLVVRDIQDDILGDAIDGILNDGQCHISPELADRLHKTPPPISGQSPSCVNGCQTNNPADGADPDGKKPTKPDASGQSGQPDPEDDDDDDATKPEDPNQTPGNWRGVRFSDRQLQKKYGHAKVFGIDETWSPENGARYKEAIERFLDDPDTRPIEGTFRGIPRTIYVNPKTGLAVIVKENGEFESGWKLNPAQLENLLKRGAL